MGGGIPGRSDDRVAVLRVRTAIAVRVVGAVVLAVAVAALIGNVTETSRLARLVGRGSTVKANTAILLGACGGVLAVGARRSLAGRVVGALVAIVALVTLVEYATGWDLGIDELVLDDPFATGDPGRMAELTAACLVLIGAALVFAGVRVLGRRPSVLFLLAALALAVIPVVGHVFSAPALQSPIGETSIALVTAICVGMLSATMLAADADDHWFELVVDEGPGGVLLRRFVPTVVVLMFVVAWLRVRAAQEGIISDEMGVALLTTVISFIVVVAFVLAASRLQSSETDRRAAERSSAALSTELQAVIDSAPAIVTIKDAQLRFRVVNRRMRELFDVDHDLVGLTDHDLFEEELAAAYGETDRLVLERGETLETVDRFVQRDGEHVYVSLKFPLVEPDGEIVGVGMIATDITEQTAAAARERDLEARLARSQRLEALGQLAGGIAHDFNNLLTVILVTTELLRHDLAPGSDTARDVATIATAGERARDLTSQLLSFARRGVGRPEVVDLVDVVRRHADLLHRTLGDRVALVVEDAGGPLAVRIDPAQLGANLVNLAVNARDAMPDGGRLTISCDTVELDADAVGDEASGPGRYAALTVADTGTGMTPEIAARAFEPFFTTKGDGRGSGLGLATVYGSVAAAGGAVRLYSEPGVGTVVRVYLPLVDVDVAVGGAEHGPAKIRPRGDGSITVLVVEDDATVLTTTGRTLTDAGFSVLEAASPEAAIDLLDGGHHVDVVVTDVMMPGMTGPQLVDHLHQSRPSLPVVYVSGYTAGVLEPQRLVAEGARLVEKPFTQEALVAAVDAALARRH